MHDLIVHRRCSDTAPGTIQICAGPTGPDQPATTTTSTTSTTSTPHWSPSSSFSSSYLLVDDLPNHIHNLFEEWGQPIPIGVEYLEDELELRVVVINVNMHLKAIDFDMEDTAFDCDIDVEFCSNVAYRNTKLYGITTNYFVPQ